MTDMTVDTYTPKLAVRDNRGNTVREVDWYRRDSTQEPTPRITRHQFNLRNQLSSSIDPRQFLRAQSDKDVIENMRYRYSLTGREIRNDSVDAGARLTLNDSINLRFLTFDSRKTFTRCEYDEYARPVALFEQLHGAAECCVDRYSYGDITAPDNARGQLIRHDDPAGYVLTPRFNLQGKASDETRHFLLTEIADPDWPVAIADRDAQCESEGFTTRWHYAPGGEIIRQTDACGNIQAHRYTLLGLPFSCDVTLAALDEQPETLIPVLLSTEYDVFNQACREVAGNNVTTWREYCPALQRLLRILVRAPGQQGRLYGTVLQDLLYGYDPAGNVVTQDDAAQPTTFFRNQRVDGLSTYRYDSLYQLIEATGQESIKAGVQGPDLPEREPLTGPDAAQRVNYTREYDYDEGNNLIVMRHRSDNGNKRYTMEMVVSPTSNRAVKQDASGSIKPEDVDSFFDVNGNLLVLNTSQPMTWDARNQLKSVALPGGTENE